MLADTGVPLDHLEQATPILTAFFFGYVTAIPLLGAVSDAAGRRIVYLAGLALFAAGSAVTAQAQDLTGLVAGRGLQGFAGGSLVPVALAVVSDLYPGRARVMALGVAAGAQELGSLAGPVYGIAVAQALASWGGWRAVFWLNLPLAGLGAIAFLLASRSAPAAPRREGRAWLPGLVLAAGMGLLVLALSPDDPARSALSDHAAPLLVGAAAAVAGFLAVGGRGRGLLAGGLRSGVLVNVLAGTALVAVLAEVPILARSLFGLDDLHSALLLARFLAGVAVGALLGGVAGTWSRRAVTAIGLLLAAGAFLLMSGWDRFEIFRHHGPVADADLVLFACGLGFGLAVAPVLAAVFDAARADEQGTAAALAVLGRMTGMLAGVALLAAYGLHRFYGDLGACAPGGFGLSQLTNPRFQACADAAVQHQYHDVFLIAAVVSAVAAGVAVRLGG